MNQVSYKKSLKNAHDDFKISWWWSMMSLRIANNKIQVTAKAMPNVDQMMKEVKVSSMIVKCIWKCYNCVSSVVSVFSFWNPTH